MAQPQQVQQQMPEKFRWCAAIDGQRIRFALREQQRAEKANEKCREIPLIQLQKPGGDLPGIGLLPGNVPDAEAVAGQKYKKHDADIAIGAENAKHRREHHLEHGEIGGAKQVVIDHQANGDAFAETGGVFVKGDIQGGSLLSGIVEDFIIA